MATIKTRRLKPLNESPEELARQKQEYYSSEGIKPKSTLRKVGETFGKVITSTGRALAGFPKSYTEDVETVGRYAKAPTGRSKWEAMKATRAAKAVEREQRKSSQDYLNEISSAKYERENLSAEDLSDEQEKRLIASIREQQKEEYYENQENLIEASPTRARATVFNPSKNNNYNENKFFNKKQQSRQDPNLISGVPEERNYATIGLTKYVKPGTKLGGQNIHAVQKFKYSVNSQGKRVAVAISENFNKILRADGYDWSKMNATQRREVSKLYSLRGNARTGKANFVKTRQTPIEIKRMFSKSYKNLQPRYKESDFERMRQQRSMQAYQSYLSGEEKVMSPFLESAQSTNKHLERFNKQLLQSGFEHSASLAAAKQKVFLIDEQRRQILQNQKNASQLNCENIFSPDNPLTQNCQIKLFENSILNSDAIGNNIMTKREDSIDILGYSKSHPSIITPQSSHILDNKNNLNFF